MRVSRMRVGTKDAARARAAQLQSPGRPRGRVEGSWVTDLAELRQTIILCSACDAKWRASAKRYDYEWTKKWSHYWGGVNGACDGCRESGPRRKCYIHASLLEKVY